MVADRFARDALRAMALQDSLDAVDALGNDTALWAVADEGHRFSRAAEARMRDALFDRLDRAGG